MTYIRWILLILFVFFLQIQLSTILNRPLNLPVVLVYHYSLKNISDFSKKDIYQRWTKDMKIIMFGAFIGLMEDILSGPLIGASFFSKGFLAFLTIQSFSGLFFRWTPLLGVIVISALTFLDNVIILGFRMIFSESSMNIMPYLKMIFIQIITNLPFGIIIKPKLNK